MKNLKVLFTVLCMVCATVVWGETATLTLSSSKKFGTTSGATLTDDQSITWTSTFSSSNVQNSYNTTYKGQQLGSSSTKGTNTFTADFSGKTVTKVVVTAAAGNTSNTVSVSVNGVSWGEKILSKTSTAYTFTGSAASGKVVIVCTQKAKNANYLGSIQVTYESSGSTETTYSVTFNAGTNGTCGTTSLTETSQNSGVTLPSCTPNAGYTFVGWSTSSSATSADAGKAGAIYKPSKDCTLYAVYSAAQNYTVTWVVGSNPSKTQSYTTQVSSGSKATPPAELTLTGSEIGDCVDSFVGWSKSTLKNPTDTPPSDLFKDVSPDAITENTTFYAVFATKQQ